MNTWSNFWGCLILLSVSSFFIISLVVIVKGYGELKDIFKQLGRKQA